MQVSNNTIDALCYDCAVKQKKGLHFILASVFIWMAITIIQLAPLSIGAKTLYAFCCSALLMPLSISASKILKIKFSCKENPLSKLGIIFSLNQLLYILIAMWIYDAVPEKMLMVYAMIFGAHLLPFGWLYRSRSYTIFAIAIPIGALLIGLFMSALMLSLTMVLTEIVFCICIASENNKLRNKNNLMKTDY